MKKYRYNGQFVGTARYIQQILKLSKIGNLLTAKELDDIIDEIIMKCPLIKTEQDKILYYKSKLDETGNAAELKALPTITESKEDDDV